MYTFDALIIGQGIAGSALAIKMLLRGKELQVFHHYELGQSSDVAAGIFNPVSGKRFTPAWRAAECFDELHRFYLHIEELSNRKFFYPMPITRIIPDPGTANDWLSRLEDPQIAPFVDEVLNDVDGFKAPHGAISLKMGGWVHTADYLFAAAEIIKAYGALRYKYSKVTPVFVDGMWQVEDYQAPILIDCGGLYSRERFPTAPFTPMKGEIIDVYSKELPKDSIVTGGCFVCPTGGFEFRVGSTYDWRNLNNEKTPEARKYLEDRLRKLTDLPFQFLYQRAAIRPSVKDRRPMLGRHPQDPTVFLFNGLGSKGVSMAPYLADLFIDYVFDGTPLPPEIDLARFG